MTLQQNAPCFGSCRQRPNQQMICRQHSAIQEFQQRRSGAINCQGNLSIFVCLQAIFYGNDELGGNVNRQSIKGSTCVFPVDEWPTNSVICPSLIPPHKISSMLHDHRDQEEIGPQADSKKSIITKFIDCQ